LISASRHGALIRGRRAVGNIERPDLGEDPQRMIDMADETREQGGIREADAVAAVAHTSSENR